MSARHDLATTLPWMREGTARLLTAVDALGDDELRAPSALPGWTRAHVVGHVARNAEALGRLVAWARTGVETPMYAGPDQRADDIESSAGYPADRLRAEARSTAADLDAALDALDDAGRTAVVRSAQGRDIPAAEIGWMRIREVWLHAVDLGSGARTEDLPAGVVDVLLDDVTAVLGTREGCPPVRLVATDREREWTLGTGPDGATEVRAPAALLAGWVTGRVDGGALPGTVPSLPRWL